MNTLKLNLFLIFFLCFTALTYAQTTVTGPETAQVGEPIKFKIEEGEAGDIIQWQLLSPRRENTFIINTELGLEFIVDAGCKFSGKVEVLCTVVNFENKKFIQEVMDCTVGNPDQPDTPDVPDNPDVPDDNFVSKVKPDKFDNIGIRIDTVAHNAGMTRRMQLSDEFKKVAEQMRNYELRTPGAVKAKINAFIPPYRPEWNAVFNLMAADGENRVGMVWSETADWYESCANGMLGETR